MNTVAHVSAYFGNLLKDNFGTGMYFTTKDGVNIPRNTQYPIIIFGATEAELYAFASQVRGAAVKSMYFVKEMIETSDDSEIISLVAQENEEEVTYLGVGVFGDNGLVKNLTKSFKLWS